MIKKILFTFLIVFGTIGFVQAQAVIQLEGNGNIITNGQTAISTTDDTDFGPTFVGSPVTRQFTINNTGTSTLFISLPPGINDLGTGTSDFSTTDPIFNINPSSSSTFDVTFNPSVVGIQTVEISITSSDPTNSPYTFNIQGEGITAPPPTMTIEGNGNIIANGQTAISTTDDTDFGPTFVGSPVVQQFTINNTGASILFISLPPGINDLGTGTSDFSTTNPTFQINPSSSSTFDVTFNPSVVGIQTVEISISSSDPTDNPYTFNIQGEGITPTGSPTIEVYGAGDETTGVLILAGDSTPDITDETDFGQVLINTTKTNTYTIFNSGTADLDLTTIQIFGNAFFLLNNIPANPTTLVPGASTTIDVDYLPTSVGTHAGTVQIFNSDNTIYQFSIAGEGANVVISNDIIITQYYEGGGDNQWIEIKNISGGPIAASTYFLCLYTDQNLPVAASQLPDQNVAIPAMIADQVILFKNPNATLPLSTGVVPEPSDGGVCSFSGNDVVLISTTIDGTCYGNRQDIIGDSDGNRWGGGTSFIRGGCASETPDVDFVESNWINLASSAVVDIASVNSNIALGTQLLGATTWTGASWDNGFADQTRNVVISAPYSASNGTIEACSLTVNAALDFDGGTQESVIVYNNLTINAPFTIGDQESLVTYNPNASISGNITKNENSTPLINIHDNTYWSSPVVGSNLGTVFAGVNANRIFILNGAANGSFAAPYNHWFVASGAMQAGRGYAVEGASTGVQNISFEGTPNNGTITIPVFYKGSGDVGLENDNFNLLGNPYPAALFLDSFLSDAQHLNIDGTIYLWNHATEISNVIDGEFSPADYATYTVGVGGVAAGSGGAVPNGFLASGQGFMITTTGPQNFVTFENDDVVPGNNSQFFKQDNVKKQTVNKEERDRVWLNLTTNNGGFSQILIGFFDDATDGKDRNFDGLKLKVDNPITFYSLMEQNNSKYAIQGLSTFNTEKTVALGFDTEIAKTFKIGIENIEGALKENELYLVDNLLNITHDLKASDYDFEQTTTGEFKNRFTLQFAGQILDVDDIVLGNNDFIVSNEFESLKISASKNVNSIKVYDLLGRMLINAKPNKQSFELKTENIKIGTILLIEATLENGATVSKKTIKY